MDHEGNEVDGDQIMAILAVALKRRGKAQGRRPGGHRDEQPRPEARAARGTASRLRRNRRWATATCWRTCATAAISLGGEQSGHVIFADYATTGDGVLTGLQLAAQVAHTGQAAEGAGHA